MLYKFPIQIPAKKRIRSFSSLEHLWLDIPGRNKNSRILIGVIYRSPSLTCIAEWLDKFDYIVSNIKSVWKGEILITEDFNINIKMIPTIYT